MQLSMKKEVLVEAKTLRIHLKVSDRFNAVLEDAQGETIHEQEDGYVPSFMPGDHYGDYVILDVDIDTGTITNWKKPAKEDIEKWMEKAEY